MKILFTEWAGFGQEDMKEAFLAEGHELAFFPFSYKDPRQDAEVTAELQSAIRRESPDAVFSFNYFPVLSEGCRKEGVPYLSWIYDSPYVMLYSYTTVHPCNHIFTFDKAQYLEFAQAGIHTVHYLPLAANTDRYGAMTANLPAGDERFLYDVSFVGSLYTEEHNFYDRMKGLSDYARGYLEGLMAAQTDVQGVNFIQESLAPVMDELYKALPMDPNPDGVESREYLYAQYVINRKITALERQELLAAVAEKNPLDLFTRDAGYKLTGSVNHGTADYLKEMPLVFARSKINLNITLRSIQSGVPLRAWDILGCGGFLLSNYQEDFLDFFVPGEDYIYYESKADLVDKVAYFRTHDAERNAIAESGRKKVAANHTWRHRVKEMLATL